VAPPATPPSTPAQPHQAKPKPPVKLADETLNSVSDVKAVTLSEVLKDEVPW
jgi:hypothetical protein